MDVVRYGEWEIAVDREKTKEYYQQYVVNEKQAHRDYLQYCEQLSEEEQRFFESFAIRPSCYATDCVGEETIDFCCEGYYLVCGKYLKYPEDKVVTFEDAIAALKELFEKDFEGDSILSTIRIGRFSFDFQCEAHSLANIPDNIPEGFICIRFSWDDQVALDAMDNQQGEEVITPIVDGNVEETALLTFLKERISETNTLDEIIDAFEEMCQTPIEDDLLMLEYGVFDWTGEDLFYFELVRQYPDGDGEYYQLRVSLALAPDHECRELEEVLWSDDTDENFFAYIRKSSGYAYAKNHPIKALDIRIDQT